MIRIRSAGTKFPRSWPHVCSGAGLLGARRFNPSTALRQVTSADTPLVMKETPAVSGRLSVRLRAWRALDHARQLTLLLALLLLSARLPSAGAQEAESGSRYRALIETGVSEFAAGHYEEARVSFAEAHALAPTARTARGLGLVAFEQRNYPEAIERLEAALASGEKPLTGELRESTKQVLTLAKRYVARLTLRVEPPHATVTLEDTLVSSKSRSNHLVNPGDYKLVVEAPGFEREERTLHLRAAETQEVAVALRAVRVSASTPQLAPDSRTLAPSRRRVSALTYTLGALGAVGLGAYAGFGIAGKREHDRLARTCKPACSDREVHSVERNYLAANVAAGVGAVALVGALVSYFATPKQAERHASSRHFSARLSPSGAALHFDTRF